MDIMYMSRLLSFLNVPVVILVIMDIMYMGVIVLHIGRHVVILVIMDIMYMISIQALKEQQL